MSVIITTIICSCHCLSVVIITIVCSYNCYKYPAGDAVQSKNKVSSHTKVKGRWNSGWVAPVQLAENMCTWHTGFVETVTRHGRMSAYHDEESHDAPCLRLHSPPSVFAFLCWAVWTRPLGASCMSYSCLPFPCLNSARVSSLTPLV